MFSSESPGREAGFLTSVATVALVLLLLPRVSFALSFTSGQAASTVIGQHDFTSLNSSVSGSLLFYPRGFAFDAQGNLWVADAYHNRVLEFLKGSGFANGESASLVIGQTSLISTASSTTADGLNYPWAVAFDSSGNLWVTDAHNSRVLEYLKGSGFTSGQSASLVIGQPNFTSSACADSPPTAVGMCGPSYLAFDSSGNLWVTDEDRVLEYALGSGFTSGQAASLVIGQANLTSQVFTTTASGFQEPAGIAFDSTGNLWVSDLGSNRVLEFSKGEGFVSGEAASLVLGQVDFSSNVGSATATGLYWPWGLAFDSSGNLWVADGVNNRVLEYMKGSGFVSGQAASVVIGQGNFTSKGEGLSATGMNYPNGVAFDSAGNLWVSDSANGRLLSYEGAASQTTQTTSTTSSTATTRSTSTHSSQLSTSTSRSTSSSSGSGAQGIPEFPGGAIMPLALSVLLVASYLLIRRLSPVRRRPFPSP